MLNSFLLFSERQRIKLHVPLEKTDPVQGYTYPSFLQSFGLEFLQKVAKFVLQEVSLFCILNFNVFLLKKEGTREKKTFMNGCTTNTSLIHVCKFIFLPAYQKHLLTQSVLFGSFQYDVGSKETTGLISQQFYYISEYIF